MATCASEAELLIVVDNLKEFVKKKMNLRTQQHGEQVFHICATMEILEYKIKQKRGKMEKLVIRSIRELVHEAEEAIDECVYQELMMKRKNQLQKSSTSGFEKNEYNEEISTRLENVRKRFIDLLRSFEVLETLRISKKTDQRWNLKALFPGDEDKEIVGRKKEVKKVINLLENDSNGNLVVISITGMVGLGKTTVARRVFKDQKVESLFTLRAFVTVPQDYCKNKNKVFVEIFRQFGMKEEISEMEMEEETEKLVEMLGDFLNKSSNFFIVLDDVSSSEVLDDISSSMAAAQAKGKGNGNGNGNQQNNNCKWVILITTKRGAKSAVGKGYYSKNHRNLDLPLLNSDESRKLFRLESFGKKIDKYPRELESSETKILEKCYGLPLAILSFSRILSKHRRNRTAWWNRVADCVNVFTEETLISNAIRSIFEGLNDNLKLCFLYLGVFERGVEIPVWVLLRLWKAEGLVKEEEEEDGGGSSRRKKLAEEVAEDYLNELVENNLVMIYSKKSNGKIKEIQIHEGVVDFCVSEAKQENFFNESFLSENCRRFCIRDLSVSLFHRFQTRTKESNPLRSILYFYDDIQMNPLSIINIKPKSKRGVINKVTNSLIRARWPDGGASSALFLTSFVPKTFKLIRVMDVRSFELPNLPVQLFSLFLLRYMSISCNSSFLPEELSNLCNLETLIVHTSSESDTLEIRADIRNISLLEHIHTNKSILLKGKNWTKNKNKNNNNKNNPNLRTISRISNKCCSEEVFDQIPNVKKLGISWNLKAKIDYTEMKNNFRFFEHLAKLENLENLKLLNEETASSSSFNYFLPIKSQSYPNNLKILKLMNIYLEQENMYTFGTLSNLEILKLQGIQFVEPSWETKDGGFLRLKVLHIRATNLEKWDASGDHFPVLTTLFLWHCYDLQVLPDLSDMKNLLTVNLRYGHDTLAPSLKNIFYEKEQTQPGFDLTIFPDYK